MTENNDLFDMFDNDVDHAQNSQSSEDQLTADMKIHKDAAAPPLPPKRRREVRAERRRQKRKRIRKIVVWIAVLAVLAAVAVGGYTGVRALRNATVASTSKTTSNLDYPGPGSGSVIITIEDGEGTADIAKKLYDADVVRTEAAFIKAVQVADAANKLQAGSFELKKQMAAADVVTIITDPTKITGSLIVKSGETVADVIASAASLSDIDKSEFEAIINAGGSDILPEVAGGKYEGWFEPGTYNIKGEKTATDIIKAMVDKRIAKLQELGVSEDQYQTVLIKSSIVEAEVNQAQYYGKVARVIENRLNANMVLGMDSVIAYGLGVKARDLTVSQLSDSSNPYNDRIYTGLPPTPINNPGDNAISAVLHPEEGDWLYFVTVNLDTGETKFTASESEFQQYAEEYQQWEAEN
ncbi:endolytic transglycosylase MltG [Alloscardovia criceti]|uniref:endolytic transglycosylase MltG n=1 Tax=Alloscardovia criceti TaxID=356828 RepID=UPI00036491B4|nr:endolytic transglycosylase MltG [Alloscardovia criceti]